MFRRITLLVVAVCLIQGHDGSSTSDLINDLKPTLAEARAAISKVLVEGGQSIRHTYEAIETAISVLDKDLNQKRDDLEASVKQGKTGAEGAGKNIDPCVDQVKRGLLTWSLSRVSLETCRNRPALNRLGIKLAQVAKLEGAVATSVIRCSVRNPGDAEKIKACVEETTADVEQQAQQAAKDIAATVASDQENANQCANCAASDSRAQLQALGNDFTKCVSKV